MKLKELLELTTDIHFSISVEENSKPKEHWDVNYIRKIEEVYTEGYCKDVVCTADLPEEILNADVESFSTILGFLRIRVSLKTE